MIKIIVKDNGIEITGHASYAPSGQDIVCAAVSILAQTFVASIEKLTKDKIMGSFTSGHYDIHFENLSEKGHLLRGSFLIGICGIYDLYGEKYLEIIRSEDET